MKSLRCPDIWKPIHTAKFILTEEGKTEVSGETAATGVAASLSSGRRAPPGGGGKPLGDGRIGDDRRDDDDDDPEKRKRIILELDTAEIKLKRRLKELEQKSPLEKNHA